MLFRRGFKIQDLIGTTSPAWRDEQEDTPKGRKLVGRLMCTICVGLALLYLPVRLVEEATPEWRPVQWALAVGVVGLTVGAMYSSGGRAVLKQYAFPVAFFFVAIPWPTIVEQPIIQALTRVNASLVVEIMTMMGVPAMQHGNVIEVGSGLVGIDEACSGIRSFQSSLMISLFVGEYFRLSTNKRWLMVPLGYLISFFFNACRTSFLTWIAAKKGVEAISQYHDSAGVSILLACTAVMWGVGYSLRHGKQIDERKEVALPPDGPAVHDSPGRTINVLRLPAISL